MHTLRKALELLLVLALCLTLMPIGAAASGEPAAPEAPPADTGCDTADSEWEETAGEPSADLPEPEAETCEAASELSQEPEPEPEGSLPQPSEPAEGYAPPALDGASNEETVYAFLTGTMGFNTAAACGIMGTIYGESRFDPNVTGDNSTSYGICQWHDWGTNTGRYTYLKNFCAENGYDYRTLEGQLYFLQYELNKSGYGLTYIRDKMYTFPDTAQGAYDAGYYWCKEFGRPADPNENGRRGVYARDMFYPKYAKVVLYTVSFDACGGIAVTGRTVTAGSAVGTLPASTRPGYTFGGWYSGKDGSGTRLTEQTAVTSDSAWYARWDACRYFVSFEGCGGTAAYRSKLVDFGAAYGQLPTAERTGYRFAGWFTSSEGGTEITDASVVGTAENHTLYAHWTVRTYTVTLDACGGQAEPGTLTVTYGENYGELPPPVRFGCRFDGWFTEKAGGTEITKTSAVETAADHTLYARWTAIITYTVTYDANGGSGAPMPQKKPHGTDLTVTATTPRRAGCIFLGWAVSPTASEAQLKPGGLITEDRSVTLYAVWLRVSLPEVCSADMAAGALTGADQAGRDADGDGRITPLDAALILRRTVGLI